MPPLNPSRNYGHYITVQKECQEIAPRTAGALGQSRDSTPPRGQRPQYAIPASRPSDWQRAGHSFCHRLRQGRTYLYKHITRHCCSVLLHLRERSRAYPCFCSKIFTLHQVQLQPFRKQFPFSVRKRIKLRYNKVPIWRLPF